MSDKKTDLITFHGWGFSSDVWSQWETLVPDHVSVRHADRGYFGDKSSPVFRASAGQKVIMTHSFGLHWCPPKLFMKADHLIIVSGFLSFHPPEREQNRRSKLLLQQMMSRFVDKPQEVLSKFYERVYKPAQVASGPPNSINHEILLEDLALLGTAKMQPELLHRIPAITIIHGEEDDVVSNQKAHELFNILNRRSQYFEIKHSGHAVPFTHPEQCCRFLKPLFRMMVRQDFQNT